MAAAAATPMAQTAVRTVDHRPTAAADAVARRVHSPPRLAPGRTAAAIAIDMVTDGDHSLGRAAVAPRVLAVGAARVAAALRASAVGIGRIRAQIGSRVRLRRLPRAAANNSDGIHVRRDITHVHARDRVRARVRLLDVDVIVVVRIRSVASFLRLVPCVVNPF